MQLALVAIKLVSSLFSLQLPIWTCLNQHTGAAKINPAPVKTHSASSSLLVAFGCKSHGAFACAGGWRGEGEGSCCAPRGGWLQCEPVLPGMGLIRDCTTSGPTLTPIPNPLAMSLQVWVAQSPACDFLIDDHNKTRKYAGRDAQSRKPQNNIKA